MKKRNLGIDLCKIIAMFFIICHHFIVTRNGYALNQIASNNYSGPKLFILLNCFFVIAVNVFFISSGYCGINYKRRNLVTMVVNTYIVSIIISLIFSLLLNEKLGKNYVFYIGKLMIFYWYIFVYIALYYISPLLNHITNIFNKRELFARLVIFGLIFCTYGFFTNGALFNVNKGYSFLFAIYLYILGRYLRYSSRKRKRYLYIYVLLSLIVGAGVYYLYNNGNGEMAWKLYSYNNPLILIASVCFFCSFLSINIKNNKICQYIYIISKNTFFIYVISSDKYFSHWCSKLLHTLSRDANGFNILGYMIIITTCIIILSTTLGKYYSEIQNKILNKISDRRSLLIGVDKNE